MCLPSLSKLEEMTLANLEGKGQVSKCYNILVSHSTNSTLDKLNAWRMDIQEDIDELDWSDACLKAQKQTINIRFQLRQYKWLMRVYITPVILHRMSANIPDFTPLLMGMCEDPKLLEGCHTMSVRNVECQSPLKC